MSDCHICIIGGGIVGTCLAYALGAMGRGHDVIVLEPDASYRNSSTVRSAAALRAQFNLRENVALSLASIAFYATADETLGLSARGQTIDYAEQPYLVLTGPDGYDRLRQAQRRQKEAGAHILWLEPDDIQSHAPWLVLDGVAGATLGACGEGWIDPKAALNAIRASAEAVGVTYLSAAATDISSTDQAIEAITLDNGQRLKPEKTVIATGANAADIARMISVDLPIEPRKRCAFVFEAPDGPRNLGNVVDPTFAGRGVYVRSYGDRFLAVTSPAANEDHAASDYEPDLSLFDRVVRPALARRIRGFEKVGLRNAWAGFYEMNLFDQNAIIGAHPLIKNLYFSCGYSGHGVMHAPAAGQGLAELLLHGAYRSIDLSAFGFDRLLENRPLDDIQASENRSTQSGV
jgi:FAD-dependent oxidoreductase domain-containing protein 1